MRLMRQQPATDQPAYHIFNCGFSKWGAKVRGSPWLASCSLLGCSRIATHVWAGGCAASHPASSCGQL